MADIIKIGCPVCGSVLSVQNQPGIEAKNVTCPVCKTKSPFSTFKRIVDKEENTEYPGKERTSYGDGYNNGEETIPYGVALNFTLGKLVIPSLNLSFQLKPGRNIIGCKAATSSALFQIPCPSRRMSREHLVIEIKKIQGKGFVHYVSLYKERVNATFIGNNRLEYGDCVVLNHGDVIKLPDVDVCFEIPDEEATNF